MDQTFVKHLIIYPIKSLGPVFVDEIYIGPLGLAGDREMMLVDRSGKFITQRTKTELVRFQIKRHEDTYKIIDRWGNQEVVLDPNGFTEIVQNVSIWEDHVQEVYQHPAHSQWFSTILKEEVRLVKLNENFQRLIAEKHQTSFTKATSFADSLPILLCTTASFLAVEEQYGLFDFLRFRPNIVIKNSKPFEEDLWTDVQIGKVDLSVKKKCARCNLITIDPQTGEADQSFLGNLASYRKEENKVNFGVQLVPQSGGKVAVGDLINVN